MTDKQFETLLNEVKSNHQSDNVKTMNTIWRGVSTIGLGLTFWIFTTTQNLDKRTAVMEKGQGQNTEELIKLNIKVKEFTEKPRFTQEDFNRQLSPILSELNKINVDLKELEDFMEEGQDNFQTMELRMSVLENKMK